MDLPQSQTSEADQAFIRGLCEHVVTIGGSYCILDENGKPCEEKPFAYTAFIISLKGQWCLVTAGHVLDDIDKAMKSPKCIVGSVVLTDEYGLAPKFRDEPIPFNPLDQPKLWINDEQLGLDVALVLLTPHYVSLLKANDLSPAPLCRDEAPAYSDYSYLGVVGFPEERIFSEQAASEKLEVWTQPHYVPLKYDPTVVDQTVHPRLTVRIVDKGELKSAVGFSGGPIFGFKSGDDDKATYEVVAVQSSWDKKDVVFGCPLQQFIAIVYKMRSASGE